MGTPQTRAALIRGAYLAVGTFLSAFLSALLMDSDVNRAAIVAGVTALGVLGFRGGVEGAYDAHRQKVGDVHESDVGVTVVK